MTRLPYVYYCLECDRHYEHEDMLNEGGYTVCPDCLTSNVERRHADSAPWVDQPAENDDEYRYTGA